MENRQRRDGFDVTSNADKTDRTDRTDKKAGNVSEKVRIELEKYFKKGGPTTADIIELRSKYGEDDSFLDEFLKLTAKRHHRIKKQARELAEKIYRKYTDGNRPLHEILDKMMKYKIENKWSDIEYDEFRKELSNLITGNKAMEIEYNQNVLALRSRINKALGARKTEDEGLRIKDSENGVLSEILSMLEKTAQLHRSVFMQSLTYEDCSLVAMTGEYKRDRHTASNYIHPIIACMFLPKLDIFENHMLHSNFGSIIKARYEKKPITTEADALLFSDIVTDPNDVVCDISSPITDIRNRYRVQIALWETVLKLRNGNYYDANSIGEFLTTLNTCRNNLYDNADLAYSQDEGAIIRKLLSVFSLRPTIISTKPIHSIASFAAGPCTSSLALSGLPVGNMPQGVFPFNNQPVYTITSVPMITLQLPPYTSENDEPKNLRDAIKQTLWINEHKNIIPKEQAIIYSKEVLIFYVNRRVQRIQIKTFANPIAFSQLPLTMSNFERLNAYPVHVPERISIKSPEESFELRSVVTVSETEIRQGDKTTNIITGTTGLIMTHRNIYKGFYEPTYYLYDPFGASLPVRHPQFGTIEQDCNGKETAPYSGQILNKPISHLPAVFSYEDSGIKNLSFFDRASKNGTIFIYAKPSGYQTSGEIVYV